MSTRDLSQVPEHLQLTRPLIRIVVGPTERSQSGAEKSPNQSLSGLLSTAARSRNGRVLLK